MSSLQFNFIFVISTRLARISLTYKCFCHKQLNATQCQCEISVPDITSIQERKEDLPRYLSHISVLLHPGVCQVLPR